MIYSYKKSKARRGLVRPAPTSGDIAESTFEGLIADNPGLLFANPEDVLLVGRQRAGARHPDLVFLDGAQNLFVVEVKRGAADRTCVGQVQEYGAQISEWGPGHFEDGWTRMGQKQSLRLAYLHRFGFGMATPVPRRTKLVIVARGLKPGVGELLEWLRASGTPIHFVPFELYHVAGRRVIEMAPIHASRARRPSADDWYFNTNETYRPGAYLDMFRRNIAVIAGFGAKGGVELLSGPKRGDRVFAYLNRHGYIGVGRFGGDGPRSPRSPLWRGAKNELHRSVDWYARVGTPAGAVTASSVRKAGHRCPGRGRTLMKISDPGAGDEIESQIKRQRSAW
jgi:hypothetical protein